MAKILVTMEGIWYDEVRNLKNYNEKSIESRLLKNGNTIFQDFHYCLCNYTFNNPAGEKAKPDIILISKDFKRWVIVEVELIEKGLSHTLTQLSVFSDCTFEPTTLLNHLKRKIGDLIGNETNMLSLFKKKPDVLVVFDGYDQRKIDTITKSFNVQFASIEVFRTGKHNGELLKIYGEYPYQTIGFTFLKPIKGNDIFFDVTDNNFFKDSRIKEIDAFHDYKVLKLTIIRNSKTDIVVKIPYLPFEPNKALVLEKTIGNKFIIKPL